MADDETKVPPEYPSGGTAPRSTDIPSGATGVTVVIQPQPMIAPTPVYKMDDLAPHSFMTLAIAVAIFCGFFHIPSLICSIPAVTLSAVVHKFIIASSPGHSQFFNVTRRKKKKKKKKK